MAGPICLTVYSNLLVCKTTIALGCFTSDSAGVARGRTTPIALRVSTLCPGILCRVSPGLRANVGPGLPKELPSELSVPSLGWRHCV